MRRPSPLVFVLAAVGLFTATYGVSVAAMPAPPKPGVDPTKAPTKRKVVAPRDCADPMDRDRDQDGHPVQECGGDDCDDTDAFRFPGAGREQCDGLLPDGRPASGHDEDCNPCTVRGGSPDGDADHDREINSLCTNPFLGAATPTGCDETSVRIDTIDKRVRGGDCDDVNSAVRPGTQVCESKTRVSLCQPMGGLSEVPTTSAPAGTAFARVSGKATVACAAGNQCIAQPDGTGVCAK